jgi:hypothetical protein
MINPFFFPRVIGFESIPFPVLRLSATVNADGIGLLAQVAAKVSRGSRSKVRAATRQALLRAAPQLRVLLLHHDDCAKHVACKPHQESPERISAILALVAKGAAMGTLSADEVVVSSDFAAAATEQLLRSGGTQPTRHSIALRFQPVRPKRNLTQSASST